MSLPVAEILNIQKLHGVSPGQLRTAMKPSVYLNTSVYLGPLGEPPLPRSGFIVLSIIMALVTGPAIVLNATVIIVSLMHQQLRQPLNYALVNMAVADLGTAMTGGVLSVVNNAQGRFSLGRTGCVLEGFTVSLCGEWRTPGSGLSVFYGLFPASKTFERLHIHWTDLTFADPLLRHHVSLHGCSHRSGEDVCYLQTTGPDTVPKTARTGRDHFILALVLDMELTPPFWLGQV